MAAASRPTRRCRPISPVTNSEKKPAIEEAEKIDQAEDDR
jgi:methylphosphotriester-DNA--protein-cysteine methyltransferase